jgi:hypothetical protein
MEKESEFERHLRSQEMRALPEAWRGEILGNALGGRPRAGSREGLRSWVPKPILIPVAAAWVVIVCLQVLMPGGGEAGDVAVKLPPERGEGSSSVLVAWAERVKAYSAEGMESRGRLEGEMEGL